MGGKSAPAPAPAPTAAAPATKVTTTPGPVSNEGAEVDAKRRQQTAIANETSKTGDYANTSILGA
jgi:hypothetical protein